MHPCKGEASAGYTGLLTRAALADASPRPAAQHDPDLPLFEHQVQFIRSGPAAAVCASDEGVQQPTMAGASWMSASFLRASTMNKA